MPPISDDEMDDVPDEIPAKAMQKGKAMEAEFYLAEEEEGDAADDDEEGPDEYVVEKILNHGFTEAGDAIYQVKWLGYERKKDITWEPLAHLATAQDIVDAYHVSIGGMPTAGDDARLSAKKAHKGKRNASDAFDSPAPPASAGKKRGAAGGRKSQSNGLATPQVEEKPAKRRNLPEGSWEEHIQVVSSITEESERGAVAKGGEKDTRKLKGYVLWNDGVKTQHTLQGLRNKCPQKLLDYYEQHLVFSPANEVKPEGVDD